MPGLFSFKDFLDLDAQDLEFFHREADKAFLERKRERLAELRMAYHADPADFRQEFEQIKWGLVSIEKKDEIREREKRQRKERN